jgi:small subunit ribosomal protein S9
MNKVINTQGKRKSAIARASLKTGKGKVTFNGQVLGALNNDILKLRVAEPLVLAGDLAQSIDLDLNVVGGGISGQADAARLAIARALVQYDNKLRATFEDYDRLLLVADVRRKETRKPNDSKARAKRQKSYR